MNCSVKRNRNRPECRRSGDATFNLIIPKRDNSGKSIKTEKLKPYIEKVNKIFGGSTTIPKVYGCYTEEDNGRKIFKCEQNMMIIGSRDFNSPYNEMVKLDDSQRKRQIEKDYLFMQSLARKASKELGQDSIFVSSTANIDVSTVKKTRKTWKYDVPKITQEGKTVFLDKVE